MAQTKTRLQNFLDNAARNDGRVQARGSVIQLMRKRGLAANRKDGELVLTRHGWSRVSEHVQRQLDYA